MLESSSELSAFARAVALLEEQGVSFVIHEHEPTRTIEDAQRNLSFDVERIVKTIAFQIRDGRLALAALRGTRRVDYARLAGLLGVNRRDLRSLAPGEVSELLGVAPGGVSPLIRPEQALVLLDEDALSIRPTLYCGAARLDRTFELAAEDLLHAANCQSGIFSK